MVDLYLLNGDLVDGFDYPDAVRKERGTKPPKSRLFRNVGNFKFVDVTASSGLDHVGLSVGVTIADKNNDGYPEVFVCNHGVNQLYWNRGDGTFEADLRIVTRRICAIGSGASFLDINNDSNWTLCRELYQIRHHKKIVRTIFGVEASAGPLDYPPDC